MNKKFYILSTYGELLELALHLQDVEKCDVVFSVPDHDCDKIGEGMVKKDNDWFNYMGKGYVFVIDGCEHGELQTFLRSKGEAVFGNGGVGSEKLESNRQLGQQLLKLAGFPQPESKNFTNIDEAIRFVAENKKTRYVLKQNGDAPKHLNYIGKFADSVDLLWHLDQLKTKWNESEYGKFDVDVMEYAEGTECAVSGFFNGTEFLKGRDGKVAAFINFEDKKSATGGLGPTCGEMGTTFIGTNSDNPLVKEVLMRPKIIEALKALNYRGVFDINGTKTKKGYVAFEFTMRPGIPTSSYEFIAGLDMLTSDLLSIVAKGENKPISIHKGIGMVMVVAGKPFPTEADLEPEATSLGEKLWILKDKVPQKDFSDEQRKNIHLENFQKKDGDYLVATKNGYLLTVTGRGRTISSTRDAVIEYIKSNIYISDMVYRTDIGKRVEDAAGIVTGGNATMK